MKTTPSPAGFQDAPPVAVTVLHAVRLPGCGRGAPPQDLLELYAEAERVALDHFAAMGRIVDTLLGERLAAEPDGARRVAA